MSPALAALEPRQPDELDGVAGVGQLGGEELVHAGEQGPQPQVQLRGGAGVEQERGGALGVAGEQADGALEGRLGVHVEVRDTHRELESVPRAEEVVREGVKE